MSNSATGPLKGGVLAPPFSNYSLRTSIGLGLGNVGPLRFDTAHLSFLRGVAHWAHYSTKVNPPVASRKNLNEMLICCLMGIIAEITVFLGSGF